MRIDKCCGHCDWYIGGAISGGCFCPDVPGHEELLGFAVLPTDACEHFSDSMSRELSDDDLAEADRQARKIREERR